MNFRQVDSGKRQRLQRSKSKAALPEVDNNISFVDELQKYQAECTNCGKTWCSVNKYYLRQMLKRHLEKELELRQQETEPMNPGSEIPVKAEPSADDNATSNEQENTRAPQVTGSSNAVSGTPAQETEPTSVTSDSANTKQMTGGANLEAEVTGSDTLLTQEAADSTHVESKVADKAPQASQPPQANTSARSFAAQWFGPLEQEQDAPIIKEEP